METKTECKSEEKEKVTPSPAVKQEEPKDVLGSWAAYQPKIPLSYAVAAREAAKNK